MMTDGVNSQFADEVAEESVDAVLRAELAHGDLVLSTVGPIIGQMLASRSNNLFSDEIVARVRGMVDHLARQLLQAQASSADQSDANDIAGGETEALVNALSNDNALLLHCHARAVEWQLTQTVEKSGGIDPVLTPLVQSLIASTEAETAALAMATLASQARYTQQMRRMELPFTELPGDIFHRLLVNWRMYGQAEDPAIMDKAEAVLRNGFDERLGRTGLMSRLVAEMGANSSHALSISHAGVALFLSALSLRSGQYRDLTVQSTDERQLARLALALRAAGLKPTEIEQQFLRIHPDIALPENFDHLRIDQAAAILAPSDGGSA